MPPKTRGVAKQKAGKDSARSRQKNADSQPIQEEPGLTEQGQESKGKASAENICDKYAASFPLGSFIGKIVAQKILGTEKVARKNAAAAKAWTQKKQDVLDDANEKLNSAGNRVRELNEDKKDIESRLKVLRTKYDQLQTEQTTLRETLNNNDIDGCSAEKIEAGTRFQTITYDFAEIQRQMDEKKESIKILDSTILTAIGDSTAAQTRRDSAHDATALALKAQEDAESTLEAILQEALLAQQQKEKSDMYFAQKRAKIEQMSKAALMQIEHEEQQYCAGISAGDVGQSKKTVALLGNGD